eukprot:TRINITY_DN7833_c0_g1_i1.p1 TRINITY_DN7833_c0_g1~~TRINITY_DN7833_c0_g1_i1.p1  ORF type:complete len:341 (+),score=74.05 TRINITY_DN7833_c0_g1_i1:86-1024(+)
MAADAPRQTPLTCSGHTRPVVDLAFSPITADGFFLVSACKDGKPMLRRGDTGDWVGTFEGHQGAVWGIAIDEAAERVATGSADFTAKLWNAISGDLMATFKHPHIVKTVHFSKDGKRLLTGCNDKSLRIFNLDDTEAEPITCKPHTAHIKRAVFFSGDQRVASGGDDKVLRIFNASDLQEVHTMQFDAKISDISITDRGHLLVSSGTTITLLNSQTYAEELKHTVPSPVLSAAIHPSQDMLVWGGEANILYHCVKSTGEVKAEYKAHFGPIHCVRFSPDGQLYASCSEDGTIRLWQTYIGTDYGLWKFSAEQ